MTDAGQRFRDLLRKRFGWRLENDRGDSERVLADRRGAGRSAAEYVEWLAGLPSDAPEFRAIAEALAISETYFFRNPEQFAVLAEIAFPALAERGTPMRILSLGAASGEEAYSVAMTVLQARKRHHLPPVEIVGIDVSRRAIQRARGGRYSPWALRALPEAIASEFFSREGRHFRVRPDVAAMVRFEEGNLLQVAAIASGTWDIVFFRNTFMYFTPEAARAVLAQVERLTTPRSFLFIGHAETLRGISDAFALRHSHNTFYYQRSAPGVADAPATFPTPPGGGFPPAPPGEEWITTEDTAWFDEISRATSRIASLIDDRPAAPAPSPARPAAPPLTGALALLREERYEEALRALGAGKEGERLLVRAVLLLNTGRLSEARSAAEAVLGTDGLQAGAHYVLALCAERSHDMAGAARHDERAIHLDDTFAMPHLHLAMLARRRGDRAVARTHAARARALFAAEDDLRMLVFAGAFSRQALMRLCDAQADSRAS